MPHIPSLDYVKSARRWFGREASSFADVERRALDRAAHHHVLTEDPNRKLDEQASFGDRLADEVARFGGSWPFIILFSAFLFVWALLNTEVLGKTAFDPYPYIFLNLILSMLAAVQAPVIMMSQNRQSKKDRQMAEHDYEINLKSEIEIMALHEKLDALRSEQLMEMLAKQQEQITLLSKLLIHNGIGMNDALAPKVS